MKAKEYRTGMAIYMLDNETMKLTIGKVMKVGAPYFAPNGGIQKVVDVEVDIDGSRKVYVMQEDSELSYVENCVISANREQLKMEVEAIKAKAEEAVKNYEKNCERLKRCDELLAELDPAVADNQRLSRLEAQLSKILEKLQGL